MFKEISYGELLDIKNYVLIDVRTPSEYKISTIANAINIPIFTDTQREIIGTTYKHIGVEEAKILGVQYVSEKLVDLYKQYKEVSNKKQIAIFCARGGMRSGVIGQTLSALGMPILKIQHGYKGYRAFLNEHLPKIISEIEFVTLYGKTGTGKTNILSSLKQKGANILDLEKSANHRGSLLGSIGLNAQNSQKQFEALVFDTLIKRTSNIVFTEGESKRIGNVVMPNYLFDKINTGKKILIDSPIEHRVKNIRDEYLKDGFDKEEIKNAIRKLNKYVNNNIIENYISLLDNDNYDAVIKELMVNYYDNNYACSKKTFDYNYININEHQIADKLISDFLIN